MSSGPPMKRIRQIADQSRLSFAPTKIRNYFATCVIAQIPISGSDENRTESTQPTGPI